MKAAAKPAEADERSAALPEPMYVRVEWRVHCTWRGQQYRAGTQLQVAEADARHLFQVGAVNVVSTLQREHM